MALNCSAQVYALGDKTKYDARIAAVGPAPRCRRRRLERFDPDLSWGRADPERHSRSVGRSPIMPPRG